MGLEARVAAFEGLAGDVVLIDLIHQCTVDLASVVFARQKILRLGFRHGVDAHEE